MRFLRTFQTALVALRRNVMRAILTTLGIIIGIAAVIAMVEIGAGSSAAIAHTISSMGANMLLVLPGAVQSGGVSFGAGTGMTLTPDDSEAILRECPEVRDVAPLVKIRSQVVFGHRNWIPGIINGSTPDYLAVRDWTNLAEGSNFTDADVRNASKVCVVGQTLVRELFDKQSPIGQEIRVQNVTFKVIGVLAAKGANMFGTDQDDILVAPWTTIKFRVSSGGGSGSGSSSGATASVNSLNQIYPSSASSLFPAASAVQAADTPLPVRFINCDQIILSATSAADIPRAMREVRTLLRQRHHMRDEDEDDFMLRDMTEIMSAATNTTRTMTRLLLAVACISLVVGGVGIMNIMLVSVTERTKEIGLRMAVGARARDILSQFLIEAVLLCLAGGAIGILSGIGASWLVKWLANWPVESSPTAIVAAFFVSAAVGIIFGFYPAWKASSLDPIDALRYE